MKAVFVVVLALCALALADEALLRPDQNCLMCMNVMALIEPAVKANESVSVLLGTVDTICARFHIEDWCTTNILPLLNSLLPKLEGKLEPRVICNAYKFCNASTAETKRVVITEDKPSKDEDKPSKDEKRAVELDLKCSICTEVIGKVKSEIGGNKTQAAVEAALSKACGKIPFAKDLCKTVLVPYVTQILDGIISNASPQQICTTKLKLCKGAVAEEKKRVVESTEGGEKCLLCTTVLAEVKTLIGSNRTQAAIQKALDKACAIIPIVKNFCLSTLEPYVIQIVDGFAANADPQQICTKLKFCAPSLPFIAHKARI